eukprot:1377471-Rhodomonas_salina.6
MSTSLLLNLHTTPLFTHHWVSPPVKLYRFNPSTPLTLRLNTHTYVPPSKSSKYLEVLLSRIDVTRDHLIQTQLIQAETLNKRRNPFTVNQQVWLSTQNLDLHYPQKYKPSYLGPFPIIHMEPHTNSATLKLPKSLSRLHPTFNISLLKPYCERDPALGPSEHSHPLPVYSDET